MKFIILVLSIVISGCSLKPMINKSGSLKNSDSLTSGYGYISGFIGATTRNSTLGETLKSKLIITYVEDKSLQSTLMILGHASEEKDIRTDDMWGSVFFAKVPTGKYSVNRICFHGLGPRGSVTTCSKYAVSYDFEVNENHVSYLGSFVAESYTTEAFGTTISTGEGFFTHTFNEERDKKILEKKYPEIKSAAFSSTEKVINIPPLIYGHEK